MKRTSFAESSSMKNDITTIHEKRRQQSYQKNEGLTKHILTVHEDKKPFKCFVCDYRGPKWDINARGQETIQVFHL